MPKCKYCHENITKFDKEICPFCGGKKPLEGVDDSTYDITQFVDIMKKSDQEVKFKQRKRVTNGLLCMFLGIFGADAFYLGFKKIGFIRLIIDILIYAAISLILFFRKVDGSGAENTAEVKLISLAIWLGFYLFLLALEYGIRFLIAIRKK